MAPLSVVVVVGVVVMVVVVVVGVESALVVVVSVVAVESVVVVVVVVVSDDVSPLGVEDRPCGPSCAAEVPRTRSVVEEDEGGGELPLAVPCPSEEAVALESELDDEPVSDGVGCTGGEGAV